MKKFTAKIRKAVIPAAGSRLRLPFACYANYSFTAPSRGGQAWRALRRARRPFD